MASMRRTPSLTSASSRSASPDYPAQPDHFYGADPANLPPSPHSDGRPWLSPDDDPLAHRGIPVFKPSMEEFKDFEAYMTRVESWGMKSGIVKIIPPQEWSSALPPINEPLKQVKIKSPIEQHMLGRGGLFRQENVEKRKFMSVREWAELCQKEDFRAPGVDEVGLHARSAFVVRKPVRGKKKAGGGVNDSPTDRGCENDTVIIKEEVDEEDQASSLSESANTRSPPTISPPQSVAAPDTPEAGPHTGGPTKDASTKPKTKRRGQTREAREASLVDKAARDLQFVESFDPHRDWLPPNTNASDYTPDFCHSLERHYWRNCGLSKPAWYGADSQGSLFTDETKYWNVAHLQSTLSRLLPASNQGLPGVNTPYLYFGMWRATFAWHVEDMDLFSINYIHFGAPKFWYSVPQGRAAALEQTMRGYFPKDTSQCPQFLRHKSFLASPTLLAQSSCRPNHLVQHAGEIVVTFPRGYHAGFNLGFNCAESVNFALDSWLDIGKRAKVCECVSDSVRIDVAQLLFDRALEAANAVPPQSKPIRKDSMGKPTKKRKNVPETGPKAKKIKVEPSSSPPDGGAVTAAPTKKLHVTLKLGPKPLESETYPCCLCTSMSQEGLLRVHDPPLQRKEAIEAAHYPKEWKAHEFCANVIPETWVDEHDTANGLAKEKVVYGVDGIVKDRWNLKCSACTKTRDKIHGAPIQCTKGKCPKAFHVSCAQNGSHHGIVFTVVRDVEKDVVLVEPPVVTNGATSSSNVITDPPPASSFSMEVDPGVSGDVVRIVKKVEVQVLCPQHNPALAAAKRASKQDRIRNDLLALPSMSRIKIRVSAGVFEVSLIRVIEETGSVEVLWDRGLKREFKWGSVVFGSTDGPVQQKPSEPDADSQASTSTLPVVTYPSLSAATSVPTSSKEAPASAAATPSQAPVAMHTTTMTAPSYYPFPPRPSQHDYWPKQGAFNTYPPPYSSPYMYAGLYAPPFTPSSAYGSYVCKNGQLQWQQPYQGPATGIPAPLSQPSAQPSHSTEATPSSLLATAVPSTSASSPNTDQTASPAAEQTSPTTICPDGWPSTSESNALRDLAQKAMSDLTALSNVPPVQLAEMLRTNPALRDVVSAAIERHKLHGTVSSS